MAFTVSSLQSAEPTVRTLLRANAAVRVVRQDSNFELTFRPIDYRTAGLMVVTDASLGSVKLNGSCEGTPAGLLLCGLGGQGFDEWRGRKVQHLGCSLPPHPVVVDAKDVHDKGNSDTSSYGTQKSLAFTVAWLCPSEAVDEMDLTHMRNTMKSGEWCVKYSPEFVKQVSKGAKRRTTSTSSSSASPAVLPGDDLLNDDPILGYVLKPSTQRGWHREGELGVNVAQNA
ncbi:dnaJ, partial [Symbiodinium pilosum]